MRCSAASVVEALRQQKKLKWTVKGLRCFPSPKRFGFLAVSPASPQRQGAPSSARCYKCRHCPRRRLGRHSCTQQRIQMPYGVRTAASSRAQRSSTVATATAATKSDGGNTPSIVLEGQAPFSCSCSWQQRHGA